MCTKGIELLNAVCYTVRCNIIKKVGVNYVKL